MQTFSRILRFSGLECSYLQGDQVLKVLKRNIRLRGIQLDQTLLPDPVVTYALEEFGVVEVGDLLLVKGINQSLLDQERGLISLDVLFL